MSNTVIKAEDVSKQYRLGTIGTGSISHDLNRWWHRIRRKEDPYLKIGEENDRTRKGNSDYIWALRDICFEVQQGDVLGIIGRNGAGKSTLLKILSRTTLPTKGTIKARGRIASLLEVGTGFHPELSGRENIFLNGAILGMTKMEIKRKFDEIVDFSGVEKYIDTPVKRYSSGMYVRLAFAVAAHLEPEILIVDEVLAVGDAEFQQKAVGKMKDVSSKSGRTVLFVSHNLAAVNSLCDIGILMDKGKVIKYGEISKVIDGYHSLNKGPNNTFKIWKKDHPENQWCKVLSVHLTDNSNMAKLNVTTDDSIAIKVTYESRHSNSKIGLTIIVRDLNDNIIFCSINNHEKNYYSQPMPISEYQSTCIIPKNFLNAGTYSLGLIVFGPNFTDALEVNNILNFEILDGIIVRGDYHGMYAGVLRPLLEWETVNIGKSTNNFLD